MYRCDGSSDPIDPLLLPDPAKSGLEHVVVVTMENRSFDHMLGWLPGADGRQAGLTYMDAQGAARSTWPLAPDFQGCAHRGPDHSYEGGRAQYNNGACDGWLLVSDQYSIGYYQQEDLAFFGQAAPYWTTFDRFFCSIMGPTQPNRFYAHCGQTDRLNNQPTTFSALPTIWDRLADAGIDARCYFIDLAFIGLWGDRYLSIRHPFDAFLSDCAAGTLPHYAVIEPKFSGESAGLSGDDHPHGDVRAGQAFLNRIYNALRGSPQWSSTALIINYDEWGGFFDHVPPPPGPVSDAERALGNTDGLRGFRTPALLISPFARRNHVSHIVYDHTSVLRLVEWRWNLPPLSVRDATANNLALDMDFAHPILDAPACVVPDLTPVRCASSAPVSS